MTKYLLDKNNIEGEVEDVRNIQHTYKNPEQKVRTGVWEVEIKTKKPINKTENKIPTMTMYFERPTFLKILNKPYEQFCQEIRDRQTQQEGDINFAPSQYRNIVLDRVKHDVSDDLIIVAIQTHLKEGQEEKRKFVTLENQNITIQREIIMHDEHHMKVRITMDKRIYFALDINKVYNQFNARRPNL